MASPNPKAIAAALEDYVTFLVAFGGHDADAQRLREFARRFDKERFTKDLLQQMLAVRDPIHSQLRMEFLANRCLSNKTAEETQKEYYRVLNAVGAAIYPPKPQPSKVDISTFDGAAKVKGKITEYAGSPNEVRTIVERTLELVQRYSETVGRGNFEAAYAMVGKGLQESINLKKFIAKHQKASEEYGGPALAFEIDRVQFVWADTAARENSTGSEGWPKTTPKDARRARVVGFWIRDTAQQTGCWGSLSVSEEDGKYCIADFTFFTQ